MVTIAIFWTKMWLNLNLLYANGLLFISMYFCDNCAVNEFLLHMQIRSIVSKWNISPSTLKLNRNQIVYEKPLDGHLQNKNSLNQKSKMAATAGHI
jgi:hypothetical protein